VPEYETAFDSAAKLWQGAPDFAADFGQGLNRRIADLPINELI
jgi:hypothetical protein